MDHGTNQPIECSRTYLHAKFLHYRMVRVSKCLDLGATFTDKFYGLLEQEGLASIQMFGDCRRAHIGSLLWQQQSRSKNLHFAAVRLLRKLA